MRTIQLTHEQIDHLINGLQITASVYQEEFERICNDFPAEEKETKFYWFNKGNMFYDLSTDIKDGKLDV